MKNIDLIEKLVNRGNGFYHAKEKHLREGDGNDIKFLKGLYVL